MSPRARSRRVRHGLALALALGGAAVLAPGAAAEDADAALTRGRAALEKRDGEAAVAALEAARALAPRRGDVAFELARAYELDGRARDAVRYYAEAERLDPSGVGGAAKAEAGRLRARWLSVELEAGDEELAHRRFEKAREAFARAQELASDRIERARAFRGLARAHLAELAASGLAGRPKGASIELPALAGAVEGSSLEEGARLVDEELVRAFREAGAAPVGTATAGPREPASLVVRGVVGQRVVLAVEDPARAGAALARASFVALVDPGAQRLPPEAVSLDLAIECERDDKARPGRPERIPVTEGATVRSGDRFRLRARASRDAWLYAFIFDSQGRATLLYPGTEKLFPALEAAGVRTPNPVAGSRDALVPPLPQRGEPYWFFFDDHAGRETFYVAASLEPLPDVEGLVKEIGAAGEAGRAAGRRLEQALRDRSAGNEVLPAAEGASHLELIRGRGAAVRWVTVEHR